MHYSAERRLHLQQHVVFTDLRDKLSVASSWVCALGIAITTMLPQRYSP